MRALGGSRRAVGVALAGIFLTLIALTFDASPLFVPGVAFALLGLAAPAWVALVARGARIERRLHDERVIEGEPLEATIEIDGGRLGLPAAEIREPLIGAPLTLRGGRRHVAVRVIAHFDRRGLRTIAPPMVVIRDPLALSEAIAAVGTAPAQVLVLPRTERVLWGAGDGGGRTGATAAAARANVLVELEVDGLRPYRQGTPASRIHWPALARGAGLLERSLRGDDDSRPLVILDARGDVPSAQIDAAVRAAASLTRELARSGGCLLQLPGERRASSIEPDMTAWPAAHARLALVEGGPGTAAPMLASARARPGPVLYVSAVALERPPAALGTRAITLVFPAAATVRTVGRRMFEVSGCVGYAARGTARRRAVALV